jgi:hypothetical protein
VAVATGVVVAAAVATELGNRIVLRSKRFPQRWDKGSATAPCGNANEDTACSTHVKRLGGLCCGRIFRGRSTMSTILSVRFLDRAPYVWLFLFLAPHSALMPLASIS